VRLTRDARAAAQVALPRSGEGGGGDGGGAGGGAEGAAAGGAAARLLPAPPPAPPSSAPKPRGRHPRKMVCQARDRVAPRRARRLIRLLLPSGHEATVQTHGRRLVLSAAASFLLLLLPL
jgi:hypothetical protein